MNTTGLVAGYRLIAELLLHPDDRDGAKIAALARELDDAAGDSIGEFLADAACGSRDEYVQTLELSPPCPLYLGAHLFEEPTSLHVLGLLDELMAAGVTALKIEGRQRGRSYVVRVVEAFRRAVDAAARGEPVPRSELADLTEGRRDTTGAYEKIWR